MHILCAYTDQKLAQQGQKNSTSVFTTLTTFRISGWWSLAVNAFQRTRWLVVEQVRVAVFVEPASLLLLPHHPNQPTFEPFFVDNQNICKCCKL